MERILYSQNMKPTYENFEAECPYCGYYNIFNRATDFNTFELISFRTVSCQNLDCNKEFNINCDVINPAFEMMLLDINELKKQKKYMVCTLNIAQSIEIFISNFLCIELIYKNIKRDEDLEVEFLNKMISKYYKAIKEFNYAKLCNIFLHWFILRVNTNSFSESEKIIDNFDNYKNKPSLKELNEIEDQEVHQLLLRLYNCKINELRNKVIHSNAYRPTLTEVEEIYKEVFDLVFDLRRKLKIYSSDINYYIK